MARQPLLSAGFVLPGLVFRAMLVLQFFGYVFCFAATDSAETTARTDGVFRFAKPFHVAAKDAVKKTQRWPWSSVLSVHILARPMSHVSAVLELDAKIKGSEPKDEKTAQMQITDIDSVLSARARDVFSEVGASTETLKRLNIVSGAWVRFKTSAFPFFTCFRCRLKFKALSLACVVLVVCSRLIREQQQQQKQTHRCDTLSCVFFCLIFCLFAAFFV